MKSKIQKITFTAMVAAIYAALTVAFSFLSYGSLQVRISEALTVLPFFSSYSIIGLFIGCIVSNLFSPFGLLDITVGPLTTLLAAIITYRIGKSKLKFKKYIAPLPAIILNAVIVGTYLNITLVYSGNIFSVKSATINTAAILGSIIWVGIGELISCYGLGLPLLLAIDKNKKLKDYLK